MRVLWFEVTVPKQFNPHGFQGGGWQDALEQIVRSRNDVELGVAFENRNGSEEDKLVDNVHYFPLNTRYGIIDRVRDLFSWDVNREKLIPLALKVIEDFKPDVIHVFGSEWCFGLLNEYISIPVVIHMQGSIPPYNNAFYPPGYNEFDEAFYNLTHFKFSKLVMLPFLRLKRKDRQKQEERILRGVRYFMINLFNPTAKYFYWSEALRQSFVGSGKEWHSFKNSKVKLTTTGCSSLWKGIDTIVRTSRLLKNSGFDFEWRLVGNLNHQGLIEWKEKEKMESLNITLMGMVDSNQLIDILIDTDLYVHTAYIDNSPNSICEAQYLGVPIIATYVGGIPSLIENGRDGVLVPANSPFTLAKEIINLSKDNKRKLMYSDNSKLRARTRHDPSTILSDLVQIYNTIREE